MSGVDFGVVEHFEAADAFKILRDEYAREFVVEGLFFKREGSTGRLEVVNQNLNAFLPLKISAVLLEVELVCVEALAGEAALGREPGDDAVNHPARLLDPADEAEDETYVVGQDIAVAELHHFLGLGL